MIRAGDTVFFNEIPVKVVLVIGAGALLAIEIVEHTSLGTELKSITWVRTEWVKTDGI